MVDWSIVLHSALGSLIIALLFISSAPLWWKRFERLRSAETLSMIMDGLKGPLILGGILLFLVFLIVLMARIDFYLEDTSIPKYHPTLTDEEAKLVFAECQGKSIEATATIRGKQSRDEAQRKHRAACLIRNGYRWSVPTHSSN